MSFLGVYTLYRAAFRITVGIETSTPPITSVIVIHLSAPDSAILDDSSATRRLLSKNGVWEAKVVPSGSSTIRKLGTPNENAARSSLTGDSAASPVRSSLSDYKSLLSFWRCRFECYHDLPECVEIIHLAK